MKLVASSYTNRSHRLISIGCMESFWTLYEISDVPIISMNYYQLKCSNSWALNAMIISGAWSANILMSLCAIWKLFQLVQIFVFAVTVVVLNSNPLKLACTLKMTGGPARRSLLTCICISQSFMITLISMERVLYINGHRCMSMIAFDEDSA